MGRTAVRSKKYDTAPLVRLIHSFVKEDGGEKVVVEFAGIGKSTYYNRNRNPDKYQLGELRSLMIAFNIPKEEILAAVDKALTG